MDAGDERVIARAVKDALGGVGLTAFDKLPQELRTQAIHRYQEEISRRHTESGLGGHVEAVLPEHREQRGRL